MTEGADDDQTAVVRRVRTRDGRSDPRSAVEGTGPSMHIGRTVWTIGGVAFVLRALWVVLFAKVPGGSLLSDPILYHAYGLRIADGQGYTSLVELPTTYYPPGYPFFLGAVYRVADLLGLEDVLAPVVGLTQSLLWAVAAMAVALTARWAFRNDRAALAAGLVVACWPNLISYAGAWLSESLFVCVFAVGVAAVTFASRCDEEDRRRFWAIGIAAVMFAVATMVRPQVLLGLPLLALAWLLAGVGWRRTLALGCACVVAVSALVVPWAMRNDRVLGEPVFISTNGGDNLCVGYHPGARGGFAIPEYCDTGETRKEGIDAELRRNSETRDLAMEHIRDDPLSIPWLAVRKLYLTFRTDDDGLRGNESYGDEPLMGSPWRTTWLVFVNTTYAAIMIAAVAGIVLAVPRAFRRPRDAATLGLLAFTLAGVLVPMLFFGDPRFKVPTTPLFALFAGLTIATVVDRLRESSTKSSSMSD